MAVDTPRREVSGGTGPAHTWVSDAILQERKDECLWFKLPPIRGPRDSVRGGTLTLTARPGQAE